MKQILDHRGSKSRRDYYVLWQDGDKSWVAESDFNALDLVNEYNNSLAKPTDKYILKQTNKKTFKKANLEANKLATNNEKEKIIDNNKRPRGRPRLNNNILNLLTIFFCMFVFITNTEALKIKGNFSYCDIDSNSRYWSEINHCQDKPFDKNQLNVESGDYILYNKLHDIVSGDGYQCKKTKIVSTFDEGIFGDTHSDTITSNVKLSREDCEVMVARKICGESNQMECAGSTCWFTPVITPNYQYFQKITRIDYSCHFTPRTIIATHEDSLLFGTRCKATDLVCILHDSTVIWHSNIIHTCPLNHITNVNLTAEDKVLYHKEYFLLFQPKQMITMCKTELILTQEGILLQRLDLNKRNIKFPVPINSDNTDETAFADLQLADVDFQSFYTMKRYLAVKELACNNLMTTLQLAKLFNKRFSKIYSEDGSPTIIYSTGNHIIIPSCIKVNEITVKTETKTCYKEIAVSFTLNNKTVYAFLVNDYIIQKFSEKADCDKIYSVLILHNPNFFKLIHSGNKTFNVDQTDEKTIDINIKIDDLNDINYHHSEFVKEGLYSDHVDSNLNMVKEDDGTYLILPDSKDAIETSVRDVPFREVGIKIGWVSSILIILSTAIIITFCCSNPCFSVWYRKKINQFKERKNFRVKFFRKSNVSEGSIEQVRIETVPLQRSDTSAPSNLTFRELNENLKEQTTTSKTDDTHY